MNIESQAHDHIYPASFTLIFSLLAKFGLAPESIVRQDHAKPYATDTYRRSATFTDVYAQGKCDFQQRTWTPHRPCCTWMSLVSLTTTIQTTG
jgi:hypothetical protein